MKGIKIGTFIKAYFTSDPDEYYIIKVIGEIDKFYRVRIIKHPIYPERKGIDFEINKNPPENVTWEVYPSEREMLLEML